MFRNWGFLLTEMWVLIALAALLGLFVGWLIWARNKSATHTAADTNALQDRDKEITALRADLSDKDREIGRLNTAVSARNTEITTLTGDLQECRATKVAVPAPVMADITPTPDPTPKPATAAVVAAPLIDTPATALRPQGLSAARDGVADDLKRIKGVGPKMEQLCNSLGFYHFDQIASWTAAEVAWVDENLEGFSGRVTRDNWIDQAKLLASGGETTFSKKVDKGGVY